MGVDPGCCDTNHAQMHKLNGSFAALIAVMDKPGYCRCCCTADVVVWQMLLCDTLFARLFHKQLLSIADAKHTFTGAKWDPTMLAKLVFCESQIDSGHLGPFRVTSKAINFLIEGQTPKEGKLWQTAGRWPLGVGSRWPFGSDLIARWIKKRD